MDKVRPIRIWAPRLAPLGNRLMGLHMSKHAKFVLFPPLVGGC